MKKKGKVFIIIGLLLIAAALFLIGYNIIRNHKASKAVDDVMEVLYQKMSENIWAKPDSDITEVPDYIKNPKMDMPAMEVDGLRYIGVIELPSIHRKLPVIEDYSLAYLDIAPCRYYGSAYLDNMIVCAHNFDSHFGPLVNLRYGDKVVFTDVDGNVFTYRVAEILNLSPENAEVMTKNEWDLTLFTCTLSGAQRVTVRCERIEENKK